MQHLYYWLIKIRRFIWLGSLVSVITLALLLTLARQLLPYASDYKYEIEAQMSQVFNRPVKVGVVDARLQNFYPTLVLRDVEIIDEATDKTIFSFHEVYAGLSVIKSIRLRQPVFVNLGINGSSIAVTRAKNGDVNIKGLDISFSSESATKNSAESIRRTLGWVFSQRSLEVKNISVYVQDEVYGREYFLPYVNALFRNLANRHQIDANVILDPADGDELILAMDLRGNANDVENISGDVYLSATNLKLNRWLADLSFRDLHVKEGTMDVHLWSEWNWLSLASIDARMNLNNTHVDWKEQKNIAHIDNLGLQLLFENKQPGWQMDFSNISGMVNSKAISPTRTRITKQSDSKYVVEASRFELELLSDVVKNLPWLNIDQKDKLVQLAPEGIVDNLYLVYQPGHEKSLDASFSINEFGIKSYKKIPYLSGVAGNVWLDNQGGSFEVSSRNMRFHQKHAYRQPWDLRLLEGRVDWYVLGDGIHLVSERLKAETTEMRTQNRFHLVLPNNNAPPFMDMYSRFESDDVSQVPRYYPVNKIKPDLLKWLDKAFVSGKIYDGQLVHYGRVKKGYFPFRKKRGNFQVSFKTDNVVLDYQEGWPHISQMNSRVRFIGSGMSMSTKSAVLAKGMHIRDMNVSIADFKYPELILFGNVKGTTQPAINFVMQSPLKESMGTSLKYVEGRGDVLLNLNMQIPLKNESDEEITYQGELSFIENRLKINFDDGYVDADRFNGVLKFTERDYSARNMHGMVLGNPVNIDVNTYFQADQSSIVITGQGKADAKTMARQTRVWLFDYLYGESEYEFTAVINNKKNIYHSSYVRMNSDTKGIHMNMPAPVYKETHQARDLKLRWNIDKNVVNVQWGKSLETSLSFATEEQGGYLNRLALTIGQYEHRLPEKEEILITGELAQFSLKEWSQVLNKELSSPATMDKILPLHIQVQSLDIADLDFQIDKTGKASKQFNLDRMPDISLEIDKLQYKSKSYGQLNVELNAQDNRLQVKQLVLKHPFLNFSAQGEWQLGDDPHTKMIMDIHSRNVGNLLKMFGYSATMSAGELHATANLGWNDELYKFKMENLEGDLGFTINQGSIVDIDPGVGRVMGLFSFQALPRRLALDFNDLFATGYHFDQIKGNFVFKKGEAYSERITIQAPSSRIVMSGTTGLLRRDYDYDVIIIPGDGSNLFMAGLLAGGLQTGFVVWAIDRMVRVDKYTRLIYHLGGTWDKPDLKNLSEVKGYSSD